MEKPKNEQILPVGKPLILELNEAKNEAASAINDIMRRHNLPCYFFEPIMRDLYNQILQHSQTELANSKAEYANNLAKTKKEEEVKETN